MLFCQYLIKPYLDGTKIRYRKFAYKKISYPGFEYWKIGYHENLVLEKAGENE